MAEAHWYVAHTYSGYENKVKVDIEKTIENRGLQDQIADQAAAMGTRVFATRIREGVALRQSQAMRTSLYEYAPKSNPAKDYAALCSEIGL